MDLLQSYVKFGMTHRRSIAKFSAAMVAMQGLICAKIVLDNDKLREQYIYLVDIVSRNADSLTDFDIMALRELGVIKPPKT